MKVLGISEGHRYIAEVSHTELEQFLNLYYGKLNHLKVGEIVDLGKGYDHAAEVSRAVSNLCDFIKNNRRIVDALSGGFLLRLASIAKEEAPDSAGN